MPRNPNYEKGRRAESLRQKKAFTPALGCLALVVAACVIGGFSLLGDFLVRLLVGPPYGWNLLRTSLSSLALFVVAVSVAWFAYRAARRRDRWTLPRPPKNRGPAN